jgi:hypothetical protein
MFYSNVNSVINYARFRYNSYNPQITIRRSFILHWPMNWLDLITLVPQRSSCCSTSNSLHYFAHDRHSTFPRNYLRLQIRKKHKYVPLCVLKIPKCKLNGSSNIVSAILIWPVATRQSWHNLPQLGRVSSGGVPCQFGNIEADNYWSTIRSSTVTFAAVITKILRGDTVKNFSVLLQAKVQYQDVYCWNEYGWYKERSFTWQYHISEFRINKSVFAGASFQILYTVRLSWFFSSNTSMPVIFSAKWRVRKRG